MESTQETTAPLKLSNLLKGKFSVTKDAKEYLSDIGMLAICYSLTVLREEYKEDGVTPKTVEDVFNSINRK